MNLSCLTCGQVLQKTDSFREYSSEKPGLRKVRCAPVESTWSENIAQEDQDRRQGPLAKIKREHRRAHSMGSAAFPGSSPLAKIKREHRRAHSTGYAAFPGGLEPRLVRSPGMRRDWSFEDLAGKNEEGVVCP